MTFAPKDAALEKGRDRSLGFDTDPFLHTRACPIDLGTVGEATPAVTTLALNMFLLTALPTEQCRDAPPVAKPL